MNIYHLSFMKCTEPETRNVPLKNRNGLQTIDTGIFYKQQNVCVLKLIICGCGEESEQENTADKKYFGNRNV